MTTSTRRRRELNELAGVHARTPFGVSTGTPKPGVPMFGIWWLFPSCSSSVTIAPPLMGSYCRADL